jgi:hypothetical protein
MLLAFEYGIEMKAIVLGLAVTYHSRFADVETRAKYRENISHLVSKSFRAMNSETVLEIIRDEQNNILKRMVLPSGIAKNTALQENVFVVLVCILNKIPIFHLSTSRRLTQLSVSSVFRTTFCDIARRSVNKVTYIEELQ